MRASGSRSPAARRGRKRGEIASPKPVAPAASPAEVKEHAAPLPRHDLDFDAAVPPAADDAVDTWCEPDLDKAGDRRPDLGVVLLRGVETLGFDGFATEIVEPFCCAICLEMNTRLHPACAKPGPMLRRAYDLGWVEPAHDDGEWRAVLTAQGLEAFAPKRGNGRDTPWSRVP